MNRNPHDIVRLFTNELERIGYSSQALSRYRSVFKKLLAYCDQHGVDRYSSLVGEAFIKETFQDVELNKSTGRKANTYVRIINMLSYFEENGTVPFRFKRSDYRFPAWFQPVYDEFLAYRRY